MADPEKREREMRLFEISHRVPCTLIIIVFTRLSFSNDLDTLCQMPLSASRQIRHDFWIPLPPPVPQPWLLFCVFSSEIHDIPSRMIHHLLLRHFHRSQVRWYPAPMDPSVPTAPFGNIDDAMLYSRSPVSSDPIPITFPTNLPPCPVGSFHHCHRTFHAISMIFPYQYIPHRSVSTSNPYIPPMIVSWAYPPNRIFVSVDPYLSFP